MKFLEEKFVPIAAKIGSQKHLVAIRDGFVVVMPATIAGAIAVLINNIHLLFGETGLNMPAIGDGWKSFIDGTGISAVANMVNNGTINMMAILVAPVIAFNLAKANDGNPSATSVVTLAAYVAPMAWFTDATNALGAGEKAQFLNVTQFKADGLFVAMICALFIGEIFPRLSKMKALKITMPDGVPPAVANTFSSLVPAMIAVFAWPVICNIVLSLSGESIWVLINNFVGAPLKSISQSVFTLVLIYFMIDFLWIFGLHGANVVGSITTPVLTPLSLENVETFAAGGQPQNTVVGELQSGFAFLGGSGATIGLIIAIFIFSKSKAARTVASISVAPGIFEINEPLTFGLPIVMNVVYAIPFILGPIILGVITYFLMEGGMLRRPCIQAPWVTPPILIGFLCTGGDIRGAIWNAVEIVILTVLWTPFVMINDRIEARGAED